MVTYRKNGVGGRLGVPNLQLNGRAYTYPEVGSGEPIVHICGDEVDYEHASNKPI